MNSPQTQNNVKGNLRTQWAVFAVLLALTVVNVAVSRLDLADGTGALIAYGIAFVQGTLILVVLMHGAAEKRSIHGLLALTALFFFVLLTLSTMAYHDVLEGSTREPIEPPAAMNAKDRH